MAVAKTHNTTEVDDLQLIENIRAGDDHSFELLIRKYGGKMLAVARQITANDADAQDCLQEAFINVYKHLDQFEGKSALASWLHRIVVNSALKKLRSDKSSNEESLDALLPRFNQDGSRMQESNLVDNTTVETLMEKGETKQAVLAAIHQLPSNHRAILLARDIEQLNTNETAEIMDISASVVKTRLHRARAALKTMLEPIVSSGAL